MSSPTSSRSPGVTRRGALGAVLATTLVAGCTTNNQTRTRPGARPADPVSPSPAGDPDVALAAEAGALCQAAVAAAEATVAAHPLLAPAVEPLIEAHRAHGDLLGEVTPDDSAGTTLPAPFVVPRRADRALAALARAESVTGESLRQHAFAANSGPFARLLASISASSAQFAADLASRPVPTTGDR